MGLFDFLTGGSEDEGPEAVRRREEDVARVEGGSIPLAAERRMRELAAGTTSFTSGLSVADFALCHQAGVRPVAQVMGSSVYNVGWTRYPWSPSWQGQATFVELEALTDAWNDARSRALARLAEEAALAGSHAVVDVTFGGTRHEFLSDEIEIVVNGTAVVLADGAGRRDDGRPVLTGLSMPDYVRLRDAGHEPLGVAAASSVFYVVPSAATQRLTSGWQRFQPNQELVDYTQGLYGARERALARANGEAWRCGATGVVGLSIEQDVAVREVEVNNRTRQDLVVAFHVVGTSIVQGTDRPQPPPETVVRQGAVSQ